MEGQNTEAVNSAKASSLRELDLVTNEESFRCSLNEMADMHGVSDTEIRCIAYGKFFGEIEQGIESLFLVPICTPTKNNFEGALNSIIEEFDDLIDRFMENSDRSAKTLVDKRRKVCDFRDGNKDQCTILLSIQGDNIEIDCINKFIPNQRIQFKIGDNTDLSTADECALREHSEEFTSFFNDWTPYDRRPLSRFRRDLILSLKRDSDKKIFVGAEINETRVKYTKLERLRNFLGLGVKLEAGCYPRI